MAVLPGAEERQAKAAAGPAAAFHKRFDRIFSLRTGYEDLDKLLARLSRRKDELLKMLERPDVPLHTNASESDLRSFVTKRKISGVTVSRDGRVARDTMLGLMKTCRKLGLSFWLGSMARPFRRWPPLSRQKPKRLSPPPCKLTETAGPMSSPSYPGHPSLTGNQRSDKLRLR
ncbi:transposase [Sinorhizobium sp. BJ1]|uniref:IS66 family transposase n=1 Tax=Sinorhizobium sp. BJ1 TaxID=2035455 RepID=UPI001FE05CF7|nr:transposase [Sinorhizobium sp. BJ1]